jgi:hypothetical protein
MSDAIPEALQHLHGALALMLREYYGFPGKEALEMAEDCIKTLRTVHGSYRLGPRGLYIPALNTQRTERNEKIRAMLGPSPHSRKRVREVALELDCSEVTVWRAVRRQAA